MARIDNLQNFLTDVASAIKSKRNLTDPIPAENFDSEINSIVTGQVLDKVVAPVQEIIEEEEVIKIVTAPVSEPVVLPENGIAEVIAEKEVLAENIGLTCDKLVSGEVVLGIEGTASAGGGNGDVKLFATYEDMDGDTNSVKGDKAVVYGDEYVPINTSVWFDNLNFADNVTLSSPHDNYTCAIFWGEQGMYGFVLQYSEAVFQNWNTNEVLVRYTSNDGINYIREDWCPDNIKFDYEMRYDGGTDWDNAFCSFLSILTPSFSGLFEHDGAGYRIAKNQFIAEYPSDLLPGKTALGKNGIIVGDGSIYDNLNPSEIRPRIFNLTNRKQSYYGELPTKFISNIADPTKMHFVRRSSFPKTNNVICELIYDEDYTPKQVYDGIMWYYYNGKNNMVISLQYDTNGVLYMVIENVNTNDIVATFTADGNEIYQGMTDNALYTYQLHSDENNIIHCHAYAYNFVTLTRDVIFSKDVANIYTNHPMAHMVNNRYMIFSYIYMDNPDNTYYHSIMYDDVLGTTTLLMEDVYTTGVSYVSTQVSTYNTDESVYVLFSLCNDTNIASLYRLNKSTSTVDTLWSKSNSVCYIQSVWNGKDISDDYIVWGDYRISKRDSTDEPQGNYVYVYTDANYDVMVFSSGTSALYGMFTLNGDDYVALENRIYKYKSITLVDNIVRIIIDVDTYYYNPVVYIGYTEPNTEYVYSMDTKFNYDSVQLTDKYYTMDFYANQYRGHITILPVVESTSCDYNYSIIFTSQDWFVMEHCKQLSTNSNTNIVSSEYVKAVNTASNILGGNGQSLPDDYDGTISADEYDTALETTKEILGI